MGGGSEVRAAFLFTIERGKITEIELVMDPEDLGELAVEIDQPGHTRLARLEAAIAGVECASRWAQGGSLEPTS